MEQQLFGDKPEIVDDPVSYGSKGQVWHPKFVAYMKAIVTHPVYAGMPDAVKDDGKIQWEAPSNRSSGKYQNTHHKRREWWRAKAVSIGVDLGSSTWISDTAKRIHPSGEKPCKRCGRIVRIAYAYPNGHLRQRLAKTFGEEFEYDPLKPVTELVQRLVDTYDQDALLQLPTLLSTGSVDAPNLGTNIDKWATWIEDVYIPSEPSMLSPGAMSNAPDRFDGFHSFNLCCRGEADSGRHQINLRSYTTDRRVFEYWSEGDWIAADRLMGLIRAKFQDETCADGGDGPCSADHIGPLSLGFTHRPAFRLLSRAANSAKNNRMSLWDVQHLLEAEKQGVCIISWYAEPLWDLRKGEVVDEETALRLSKLLRDNQRIAMCMLSKLLEAGFLTFLASLLELHYAEYNVEFENLRIEDYVTVYESIRKEPRTTKYAKEQKSRRIRIGFEALRSYGMKENRHFFQVCNEQVEQGLANAIDILSKLPEDIHKLDAELAALLIGTGEGASEQAVREITERLHSANSGYVSETRKVLSDTMQKVGESLSGLWDDERYVRAPFDFEED